MRLLAIPLITLLSGCDLMQRLATAIPDLEIPRKDSAKTCEFYRQRARGMAENAWTYDWPALAPVLTGKGTPEQDEASCRKLITDAGARFAVRPNDSAAASATCSVVWLASDFERRDPVNRASTMCHEAAHILSQQREGCGYWSMNYAMVSGRIAYESVGYAVSDAMFEKHGWSAERIAKRQARRANRFGQTYRVGKLINAQCVGEYFMDVREEFRARSGV